MGGVTGRACVRFSRRRETSRLSRDFDADVAESAVADGARHAPDDLVAVADLVTGLGAFDLQHPQAAVDLAPVPKARDRLLARVAALGERDVRLVETCFGRKDRVVELLAPGRPRALDAQALRLAFRERRLGVAVEELRSRLAQLVVRNPALLAERDHRDVLLGLDLDLRGEPGAQESGAHRITEPGLGEQQEVVVGAAHDDEWRDQAGLRRQEHRPARRLFDVVREHALQEVGRVGTGDPHVVARARCNSARDGCHPH